MQKATYCRYYKLLHNDKGKTRVRDWRWKKDCLQSNAREFSEVIEIVCFYCSGYKTLYSVFFLIKSMKNMMLLKNQISHAQEKRDILE